MMPSWVSSLAVIVIVLTAALSSLSRSENAHSEGFTRILVWFGYGVYGVLAVFCIAIGAASLLGLADPGAADVNERLWGMPLLLLGAAGLWYSVWRLKQHSKRRRMEHRS